MARNRKKVTYSLYIVLAITRVTHGFANEMKITELQIKYDSTYQPYLHIWLQPLDISAIILSNLMWSIFANLIRDIYQSLVLYYAMF